MMISKLKLSSHAKTRNFWYSLMTQYNQTDINKCNESERERALFAPDNGGNTEGRRLRWGERLIAAIIPTVMVGCRVKVACFMVII